jgi:aspartyl-tRNA(Asn)/glutamyl-tRNA(Gln) amidotransferase subunit B
MSFEPVIGLEVHIQLKTARKMFCGCAADIWRAEENTHVCPVCLGLPGALPVLNQKAVELGMKVGLALGCRINKETYFERKNYFYPDLPKGYQISQYRAPLATSGSLELRISASGDSSNLRNQELRVGITRVHLEEDTAKSIHAAEGTLLDFNKSGIPLLEIVSEPEIHSVEAAKAYCKAIQDLVRRLGVSGADMEKGQMRLEANISLQQRLRTLRVRNSQPPPGEGLSTLRVDKTDRDNLPGYRVEIKNINSFRFLEGALRYEIERQTKELQRGEKLEQETRGYDAKKGVTFVQRAKEEAHDYRYFPEPDIPPLEISDAMVSKLKEGLPKTREDLIKQLIGSYKIPKKDAEILVGDKNKQEYFKRLVKEGMEPLPAANLVINRPEILLKEPQELLEQLEKKKSAEVSDEGILQEAVKSVISSNPQAVKDYQAGKEAALKFLIGQVMRQTRSKANPQVVERLLKLLITNP